MTLRNAVMSTAPGAIGLATAFLSRAGAEALVEVIGGNPGASTRSVIGVSGAVTDPEAIVHLLESGLRVRLADHRGGVFHPKLLVAGERFLISGKVAMPSFGYLGSANFTEGGFVRNIEVGVVTTEGSACTDIAETFGVLWALGIEATTKRIQAYRARFAARQQSRAVDDLAFLEVGQDGHPEPIIPPTYSRGSWAGLESFTGEYTLQVEFPRRAGDALAVLLGTKDGAVGIRCSDNVKRQMTFRYYKDNGMFRLNVPNDIPGAHWARANHKGAVLVSRDGKNGALGLEIISGDRLKETAGRSKAIGYWGRTSTREYGWY